MVERTVVYAARPAASLTSRTRAALAAGRIQLAPFLSARAAGRFCDLVAQAGLTEACRGITGLALSPRIAAAMRPLPFHAVAVAPRPDLGGLLHGLDDVLARMAGRGATARPDRDRGPPA
jgi:uroporphyrinogen-III synthase